MSDSETNTNQGNLEPVPTSWPGGFSLYKYSKSAVMFNLNPYLIALAIMFVGSFFLSTLGQMTGTPEIFTTFMQYAVQLVLGVTTTLILFANIDRKKIQFEEALSKTWPFVLEYLVLAILSSLIAIASLLVFIVPFFFIVPRILLAPYLLVRNNLTATEALRASWDMTQGHVGKVYGIIGVSIVLFLPVVTIIGIPVAAYLLIMYGAAFNLLSDYLSKNYQPTTEKPAA